MFHFESHNYPRFDLMCHVQLSVESSLAVINTQPVIVCIYNVQEINLY